MRQAVLAPAAEDGLSVVHTAAHVEAGAHLALGVELPGGVVVGERFNPGVWDLEGKGPGGGGLCIDYKYIE